MAGSSTYCTHRDLKDIYPNIDEFDTKSPVYGWNLLGVCARDQATGQSVYIAENTGLITNLYIDGQDMESRKQSLTDIGSGSDVLTDTAEALSQGENELTVDSGGEGLVDPGWVIGLAPSGTSEGAISELMLVTDTATSDTIKLRRGFNETTQPALAYATNCDIYYYLRLSQKGQWYYNANDDCLLLTWDSNPADILIESGEDYSTLITRITKNASRYFDSRVDATLPRDQWKDKEGNYDYLVVRTTALISAAFMLKAQDPTNPIIEQFEQEYNHNIDLMNGGQVKLSHQNSADSSKGILREVGTISGAIRPVDTRGAWHGTYDIIKIKITTSGIIGTCTYSVWTKNSDKLGVQEGTQVVTDEKINGDYQPLAGGLQIRFAGVGNASQAVQNDEWELEVFGVGEVVENPVVRSVKMTRGWNPNRFR
tara:strand:+ start:3755 stop:5032 length:1278 start_codon:yes stop_codon:yes gene_type:complete